MMTKQYVHHVQTVIDLCAISDVGGPSYRGVSRPNIMALAFALRATLTMFSATLKLMQDN